MTTAHDIDWPAVLADPVNTTHPDVLPAARRASEVISLTSDKPRAVSDRRKVSQLTPSSAVVASTEDLPVALGVDTDRDQRVHVDHPTLFSHLEDQRVGRDARIPAGMERPGAKRLYRGVELLGHHRQPETSTGW